MNGFLPIRLSDPFYRSLIFRVLTVRLFTVRCFTYRLFTFRPVRPLQ